MSGKIKHKDVGGDLSKTEWEAEGTHLVDGVADLSVVITTDVDDTPVNGVTAAPVSSNWAYDHAAAADPHAGYRLESADHNHQSAGAQAGKLDHGSALDGLLDDDHTQYVLESEFAAANDVLVGTGAGTLAKKTPAEVLAILSGDAGATFSWNDQILSAIKGLLLTAATELTIDGSGVITVTQMVHTVDTAGDAASDNLDTINGGTTVGLIFLRPAHTDRTVVVRTGQGNIVLQGGADISLDDITDHMQLFWDTTNSKWVDFGGGGGGAGANTALSNLASVAINTTLVSDGDNTDDLGTDAVRWKDLFLSGVIESGGGLWDDAQTTGITVHETNTIHMDTNSAECALFSSAGILTLAKQSGCHVKRATTLQTIENAATVFVHWNGEDYDIQNEFDLSTADGTAEVGTSGTTLHDDGVFANAQAGDFVWNTTDDTYCKIASVTSNDEVELDESIFAVGETFTWYRATFTATEAGKYLVTAMVEMALLTADVVMKIYIYVNGVNISAAYSHTASATNGSVVIGDVVDLSASDYIQNRIYHNAGSAKELNHTFSTLTVYKIS